MSTATIESAEGTNGARRSGATRATRAQERSTRQIESSLNNTEAAVTDLVHGLVNGARTMLPGVVVRPTEAVDRVFDIAEQAISAARRLAYELATMVEAGMDAMEREAA